MRSVGEPPRFKAGLLTYSSSRSGSLPIDPTQQWPTTPARSLFTVARPRGNFTRFPFHSPIKDEHLEIYRPDVNKKPKPASRNSSYAVIRLRNRHARHRDPTFRPTPTSLARSPDNFAKPFMNWPWPSASSRKSPSTAGGFEKSN